MATKTNKSKLTEVLDVNEVINPTPVEVEMKPSGPIWEFQGREFAILPTPDAVLQDVMKNIASVITTILRKNESTVPAEGTENPKDRMAVLISSFSYDKIIEAIPTILEAILPNATRIISASLAASELSMLNNAHADLSQYRRRARVNEDWVDDNLFRAERIDVLTKIFEAENIRLIVDRFTMLVETIQGLPPAILTDPGPTSDSVPSMDGD